MQPKLEVCITADIEFNINEAFKYPERKQPAGAHYVRRMADGKSHGLGFILNNLENHGLRGTFFLEVLNVYYFGYTEMQDIAGQIIEKGQDVQLHLHPCWNYFKASNWMDLLKSNPPNDSMAGRSLGEVQAIIQAGMAIFKNLTGCSPLALRTGSFNVDKNVYTAMSDAGLFLSSNIGLAYFCPQEEELYRYGGLALIAEVTEVPVLSYQLYKIGNKIQQKLLTITGSSWNEIKHLLLGAWRQQAGPIVILTHSHEFSSEHGTAAVPDYRPHLVNQQRFRKLCHFLKENSHLFEVVSFSQRAEQWRALAPRQVEPLKTPLRSIFFRALENKFLPVILGY